MGPTVIVISAFEYPVTIPAVIASETFFLSVRCGMIYGYGIIYKYHNIINNFFMA